MLGCFGVSICSCISASFFISYYCNVFGVCPPVLACVAFGVSLLISIFLLVKLLPTRMITQAHEQQNGSDEIREPLQKGIVLPDIALFSCIA